MLAAAIFWGIILIVLGLIGCFIPMLPGPLFSFLALLLLASVQKFEAPLTSNLILIMAGVALTAILLNYLLPGAHAGKYSSSRWSIWGAIGGMVLGSLWLPPVGTLIGALLGAAFIESLLGKNRKQAWRAAWGLFIGSLLGTILLLVASFLMTYYFLKALI